MQTTTLINFGISDEFKRSMSLHKNPEQQIDISDDWKIKGRSFNNISHKSYERIFKPVEQGETIV